MRNRGWEPESKGIDPVTGRSFTMYSNRRALPKPGRDYRPPASDMQLPNRKLIFMQGNYHSSDPDRHREMVQGREDRLQPDGSRQQLFLQQHVRAFQHDNALRMTGTRLETPEKQFQTGNKAGFLGVHNLMRIVGFLPPTLRAKLMGQAPAKDTNDMAQGVRSTESMLRPTQRPGLKQRAVEATTVHSTGSERGIRRDQSDRIEETRDTTGQVAAGQQRRMQHGPAGQRHTQSSMQGDTMRHDMRAANPNVAVPEGALVPGIPRNVDTRPLPMGVTSPSAIARGMFNRIADVLTGKSAPTDSMRPEEMREAMDNSKYHDRTGSEMTRGLIGRNDRVENTPRQELPMMPLVNVNGTDVGLAGDMYLNRAKNGSRVGVSVEPDLPTAAVRVPLICL